MSGAAGNAGNDEEVDFDRLENEASKVFALWELLADSPSGEAMGKAPPAAAAAVESPLDVGASTAQGLSAVSEVWTSNVGQTTIDGRALPREEPALAPAVEFTHAVVAPVAPVAVVAPAGAFAPDASLPDVTQAHAALPPIAAIAPPHSRPAENVVAQVRIPSQPPGNIFVSDELQPNKTLNMGSQAGAIAKVQQPLVRAPVEQFPDQTIRAEALDLPQRKVSPLFWVASAGMLLIAGTGGLFWLSSGPEDVPTLPPSAVIAAEELRPVPLPSAIPPSAPTAPVATPVAVAPAASTPIAIAPVAQPSAPVAVAPVAPPVAAALPVAAAPPVAATPPARTVASTIRTPAPGPAAEEPRPASTIRRRLSTTTTAMREATTTSMRPSSLMGDNPY